MSATITYNGDETQIVLDPVLRAITVNVTAPWHVEVTTVTGSFLEGTLERYNAASGVLRVQPWDYVAADTGPVGDPIHVRLGSIAALVVC